MSVIEVVGMVGAGKSTLAIEMTRLLEERGYVVMSRVEAIRATMRRSSLGSLCTRFVRSITWQDRIMTAYYRAVVRPAFMVVFLARNLALVRLVVGSPALRRLARWHRRTISKLFYRTGATVTFVAPRLHPQEVVILEEGLHHRAVNLFSWDSDGVDTSRVTQYLRSVPSTDLIVTVEAPVEVCVARARARGMPSRLTGQQAIEPQRFMANAAEIIALVVETLSNDTKPTMRIWNGDTVEEAIAAIDAGLHAHFEALTLP